MQGLIFRDLEILSFAALKVFPGFDESDQRIIQKSENIDCSSVLLSTGKIRIINERSCFRAFIEDALLLRSVSIIVFDRAGGIHGNVVFPPKLEPGYSTL